MSTRVNDRITSQNYVVKYRAIFFSSFFCFFYEINFHFCRREISTIFLFSKTMGKILCANFEKCNKESMLMSEDCEREKNLAQYLNIL